MCLTQSIEKLTSPNLFQNSKTVILEVGYIQSKAQTHPHNDMGSTY